MKSEQIHMQLCDIVTSLGNLWNDTQHMMIDLEGNNTATKAIVGSIGRRIEGVCLSVTNLRNELLSNDFTGLPSTLEAAERYLIEKALRESDNNREAAAKSIGIGERTLYRKLGEYGIGDTKEQP